MIIKNTFAFIVCLLPTISVNSQDYSISFTGAGASSIVESVTVENLTQGTNLTMDGSEILCLVSTTTGLNQLEQDDNKHINFYPNPMNDETRMQFNLQVGGKTIIKLVDLTGKIIYHMEELLSKGMHDYNIRGLARGIYFLTIISGNLQYSGRLISLNPNGNLIQMIRNSDPYIRLTNNESVEKTKEGFENLKGYSSEVLMQYSAGDKIKFTGKSGIYSTVIVDSPMESKNLVFNFIQCTDGEGNNYPIVRIGNQVWMAENLKTAKYLNGDRIETTSSPSLNISSEVNPNYQWPLNGDENFVSTYGRLYTLYAIIDNRKVCPSGWYVPLDIDLSTLIAKIGGFNQSGLLKETGIIHWKSIYPETTNETGFTGLPGGYRNVNGSFFEVREGGYWTSLNSVAMRLRYDSRNIDFGTIDSKHGLSIRCLQEGDPVFTTSPVLSITHNSAIIGGNITNESGIPITARGICWSKTENPTIQDDHTLVGAGPGSYTAQIINLDTLTTYYVRAYVTNKNGTFYGNQVSFHTLEYPVDLKINNFSLAPNNPSEIDQITFTAVISNLGVLEAPSSKAYIKIGDELTPTYYDVPTIGPLSSFTIVRKVDLLTFNSYQAMVVVDPDNLVIESDNSNNNQTLAFTVLKYIPETGTISDYEGNSYKTVKIGTQWWMAENLKSTRYNDGSPITYVTSIGSTPGYCWYNNDESSYKNVYGGLYNWYSINTGKLCPVGWHVPTYYEWEELQTYLGGVTVAGNKMKEVGTIHWSTDTKSNNISGFTALPGGSGPEGDFGYLGSKADWWEYNPWQQDQIGSGSWGCWNYLTEFGVMVFKNKGYCLSIRCLKDD